MEQQEKLFEEQENQFKPVITLQRNSLNLEREKERFIQNLCDFIEPINFEQLQIMGRPKANFKDIIKALCIMSYNGMSYRRTQSDLKWMFENELMKSIPPRSTLNDYSNNENTIKLIEKLIQISALFFQDNEDTMILDSTWLATRMYTGGYKRVHDKKNSNFEQTRKLHISCLKNSRVICCAKTTKGARHDCPLFEELLRTPIKNGFQIKTVIADSGYMSKNNYALCNELGVLEVFIDFRLGVTGKKSKSDLWKESVRLWKERRDIWKETYRFRVLVEGIFSAIKRKNLNYLRSKKENAIDVELLLKAFVYNITIIGKYS
ncbi:MAG: transposase [Nanoarchaeota archaeon]|nr:transposase [Nanoarchaeota archaeon]